jgi:hypothetical protein
MPPAALASMTKKQKKGKGGGNNRFRMPFGRN